MLTEGTVRCATPNRLTQAKEHVAAEGSTLYALQVQASQDYFASNLAVIMNFVSLHNYRLPKLTVNTSVSLSMNKANVTLGSPKSTEGEREAVVAVL